MPQIHKIHIFIDGTWLFRVCSPHSALANKTESPKYPFVIDWDKFNMAIKEHVEQSSQQSLELGEGVFVTSIFSLPEDSDNWSNCSQVKITEKTKRVVYAKERFAKAAVDVGYSDIGILRPKIKDWMIPKLEKGSYREKQVDTTVVALLVKSAITHPQDYHALVTGDADMIPAITTAFPEYTKNILVVSTHPDELDAKRRQSSFSYLDFSFDLPPFFLQ